VKEFIENEGYTLLSKEYVNNLIKLDIMCSNGHEYQSRFNNFQQGYRCPICKFIKIRSDRSLSYSYVKKYINKIGYTLLSKEYINNTTKLHVKCDIGHEYITKFNYIKQGNRCPQCDSSKKSSKGEVEVSQFIKSIGYMDMLLNDRTQIINPLTQKNLELDIWIPAFNKAVEYNGTYWHSSMHQQKIDRIKKQQCKQKGIDLLIIEEENWQENQQLEMKRITKWLKE